MGVDQALKVGATNSYRCPNLITFTHKSSLENVGGSTGLA